MRTESKLTRSLVPLAVLTVCGLLLAIAWPRWLSSFRFIPVEKAISTYYSTGEFQSDRLTALLDFTEQAQARHEHYRILEGSSTLQLLRALDPNTPAQDRRSAYEQAARAAADSLQLAPARSATWLRMAYVGWVLHEEPEVVLQYWKMSIFTGRTDQTQYRQRTALGIAHASFLDEEGVAMLRDQILLFWRAEPGRLASVLATYDRDLTVTRNLIVQTDPAALRDMEAWIEKYH